MVRDAGPDAARPHFSLAFAASALPRLAWTGSAGGRGGRVRGWAADPCQQPSRAAAWNRVRSPYGACYGSRRCRRRPSSWTNRLRSVASRSSNPETPSSSTRPLANDLGQGPNSARPGRRAEPRRRLHRRDHRRRLPQPGGHLRPRPRPRRPCPQAGRHAPRRRRKRWDDQLAEEGSRPADTTPCSWTARCQPWTGSRPQQRSAGSSPQAIGYPSSPDRPRVGFPATVNGPFPSWSGRLRCGGWR